MKKNIYIKIFLLYSLFFTGCFNSNPEPKKIIKDNINMKQEKIYIDNQVKKMVKMVYEDNFIQQKIADNIDDLGTSSIDSYDYTVFKTVKINFDDIDRITNNFIKIYNTNQVLTIYNISFIDYNNNMSKFKVRKELPLIYFYVISKITGKGKLVTKDEAMKYINNKNFSIYEILNDNNNGILHIYKFIRGEKDFKDILDIDLNKANDYVNSFDNIIITIKKKDLKND